MNKIIFLMAVSLLSFRAGAVPAYSDEEVGKLYDVANRCEDMQADKDGLVKVGESARLDKLMNNKTTYPFGCGPVYSLVLKAERNVVSVVDVVVVFEDGSRKHLKDLEGEIEVDTQKESPIGDKKLVNIYVEASTPITSTLGEGNGRYVVYVKLQKGG